MGDISEWVTEKEIVIDDNDVLIKDNFGIVNIWRSDENEHSRVILSESSK